MDGTMPEKMGEHFDPMAVATSIQKRYEETQQGPEQTIQEMQGLVANLKRMPGDGKYKARVEALEAAVSALVRGMQAR